MQFETLTYETRDRLAIITLTRPEKRNALNDTLIRELAEVLAQAGRNGGVKVIIITGSGKAFCAGADLAYLRKLSSFSLEENQEDSRKLMKLFQLIYEVRKPVIAKVNGPALAGGCGLATVCDFILAAREDAQFGYPEVRIGFIPAIVLVFLTRRIGEGRARELVLSGSILDADQAYEIGLVSEVVERGRLDKRTEEFAQMLISQNSSSSMGLIKEMFVSIGNMDIAHALEYAANMNALTRMTEDCKRGVAAFLNKDPLSW